MREVRCPGLPASWINGWLAGVGATVLSPNLRLRWTKDGTPTAVLCARREDPVAVLSSAWPSRTSLEDIPIRKKWPNTTDLPRNVPVEAFASRAAAVRSHPLSWALSSTLTDLHVDEKGNAAHGPLDPPVPKGRIMHERLCKVAASPKIEDLRRSLKGMGKRIKNNGLGFDVARIGSNADNAPKWIDPVVETLAFFGLALFPVRGAGTDARAKKGIRPSTIQRAWVQEAGPRSEPRLIWPAWSQPLDFAAIDALLDLWRMKKANTWPRLGIHAAWQSVKYEPRGTSDTTRGFGAQRLD